MTVPPVAVDVFDEAEPLSVDAAYARSLQAALTPSAIGPVGLEIETHLVDLDAVANRVPWDRVDPLPVALGSAAGRCRVTLEPGGQLELSGPPESDIVATVADMRRDGERSREALAEFRLGVAHARSEERRVGKEC